MFKLLDTLQKMQFVMRPILLAGEYGNLVKLRSLGCGIWQLATGFWFICKALFCLKHT